MNILLLGAGNIGQTIASLLSGSGDYTVTVADRDARALARLTAAHARREADTTDPAALARLLAGHHAVINALPYNLAPDVARAAAAAGVHYFDLT